jgi:uncharacterized protein YecE (DUF72 family)
VGRPDPGRIHLQHQGVQPADRPPDQGVRDLQGPAAGHRQEERLSRRSAAAETYEEIWSRFLSALDPLADAGKLGALLFQFPPWFGIRTSHKEYMLEVAARCKPLRPVFELRNASWFDGANRNETLDWLRAHKLPFVSVDMPQGHPSSVPPILEATADLAVVRFHGHSDRWTSRDIHEKFGYRYSTAELAEWAPRLRRLADQATETHVLMNNCAGDAAQRNATELIDLLS